MYFPISVNSAELEKAPAAMRRAFKSFQESEARIIKEIHLAQKFLSRDLDENSFVLIVGDRCRFNYAPSMRDNLQGTVIPYCMTEEKAKEVKSEMYFTIAKKVQDTEIVTLREWFTRKEVFLIEDLGLIQAGIKNGKKSLNMA